MAKASKRARLKNISFFSSLADYELHQIEQITTERSYRKDEAVVKENESGEKFIIIHKGKIAITKKFEDGEDLLLSILSNGDFFGEMALLDERPRSATARAMEPTSVLEISKDDFEALMYKAPALAYRIMKELSLRLRETDALLISHLQRKHRELSRAYTSTLMAVVDAVEKSDAYARGHTARVTAMTGVIGQSLGLSPEELFNLEIGVAESTAPH